MSSPFTWAVGACVLIAVSATVAGQRLSRIAASRPEAGTVRVASPARSDLGRSPISTSGSRTVAITGDRNGHFHVWTAIEGLSIKMLVDTGATSVALTYEDAASAGIRPFPSDFNRQVSTANGSVAVAQVRLREVRVGDLTVRDVEAVVLPSGRLGTSLLGMSFLRRLGGFDIADNRLTLRS